MDLKEFKKEMQKVDPQKRIDDECCVRYNGVESRGEEKKPEVVRHPSHGGAKCLSGMRTILPNEYNRTGWAFVVDPNGFVSYKKVGCDRHMGAVELC